MEDIVDTLDAKMGSALEVIDTVQKDHPSYLYFVSVWLYDCDCFSITCWRSFTMAPEKISFWLSGLPSV